jgi:hypothetical protein
MYYPQWFDETGARISSIVWNEDAREVVIFTQYDSGANVVRTYREAVRLLGSRFDVPKIPGFSVTDYVFYEDDPYTFGQKAIVVVFTNDKHRWQTISFGAMQSTDDEDIFEEFRFHGTIEELNIRRTSVFKVTETDTGSVIYTWRKGGLSYVFTYNATERYDLTPEDFERVLDRMLR